MGPGPWGQPSGPGGWTAGLVVLKKAGHPKLEGFFHMLKGQGDCEWGLDTQNPRHRLD